MIGIQIHEVERNCLPILRILEDTSEPLGTSLITLCLEKYGVELNKIGMIPIGGINPLAAAEEAGIEAENHAMNTIM